MKFTRFVTKSKLIYDFRFPTKAFFYTVFINIYNMYIVPLSIAIVAPNL